MSTFKVDSEQVRESIKVLKDLLKECEEAYDEKIPTSTQDRGKAHYEIQELCNNLRLTCYHVGELINNTILFLGGTSEMFDKADKGSASAILDAILNGSATQDGNNCWTWKYHKREVPVPPQGQNTNYTCGSASGSMMLDSRGVHVSEEEFWRYANSNGQGTYVYRIKDTLNHFLGYNAYRYVNTSGMSTEEYCRIIQNSLENGYPVQLPIRIPAGTGFGYSSGGHYVVVTGVYRNAAGEYVAMINDPFSAGWYNNGHQGQQIEIKLSELQKYNAQHSGYVICN